MHQVPCVPSPLNVMVIGLLDFGISCIKATGSPHHFLHQTDKLHEAAAELGHLLLHLGHMLLIDLHQRFEGVAAVLDTTKTPINAFINVIFWGVSNANNQ